MKRFYHLGTCDTCKRIARELDLPPDFERIDIKKHPFEVKELEQIKQLAGSYEALFSRRAKLYKERGLAHETLTEEDYNALPEGAVIANKVAEGYALTDVIGTNRLRGVHSLFPPSKKNYLPFSELYQ